jgi:ADP-ribosyl-[dinitrogen reductase] hydrolase
MSNDSSLTLRERALGAYMGLAVGDALGATVEFMTPREIIHRHGVHRNITGGGWLRLPAGQVTDDTTMSLALGEAILSRSHWSLRAVADRWVQWLQDGPVDCGNTCRRGLRRYMGDGSLSGPMNEGDAGNGALMRNLPVVLATLHDTVSFEAWSIQQAHLTHHHPLSDAATLCLGHMTRDWLLHPEEGLDRQQAHADELVRQFPVFRYAPYPGRASAYVVDTVQTVLHFCMQHSTFEGCLIATVNRGDDADTTGALAGMLAGARLGVRAIPPRWRKALQPGITQAIEQQVDQLLEWALFLR